MCQQFNRKKHLKGNNLFVHFLISTNVFKIDNANSFKELKCIEHFYFKKH